MKKLCSLALALLMILGCLAGCGGGDNTGGSNTNGGQQPPAENGGGSRSEEHTSELQSLIC